MAYAAKGHGAWRLRRDRDYLDVPVKLVRILVVLSIFFGLAFFTVVAYIVLSFVLDPMPDNLAAGKPQRPAANCWIP